MTPHMTSSKIALGIATLCGLASATPLFANPAYPKVDICHYAGESGYPVLINVAYQSLQAHLAHGDVRLDDADGDGFVPQNACGVGGPFDANDNDGTIYPGAPELCDGKDNNQNGETDEDCNTDLGLPEIELGDGSTVEVFLDNDVTFSWGVNGPYDNLPYYRRSVDAQMDYAGADNSDAIVAVTDQLPQSAAVYCANLEVNDGGVPKDGWYLPALGQLIDVLNAGIAPTGYYWSSSASDDRNAWGSFWFGESILVAGQARESSAAGQSVACVREVAIP